jgi:hypothetical protein
VRASFYKLPDAAAPFFADVFVVRSTVNLTRREVTTPRGIVLDHPFDAILAIAPLLHRQHRDDEVFSAGLHIRKGGTRESVGLAGGSSRHSS